MEGKQVLKIKASKALSSFGNETLKVEMILNNGLKTELSVATGISAGKYEAKTVGCDEAISQVEKIKVELEGKDWNQNTLDERLINLGVAGNVSIAISAAFWKAENILEKKKVYEHFPKLLMLLFEGAKHGNPNLSIQEFMLVEDFLTEGISDFKKLREYLVSNGIEATVGAEGGFSPMNFTNLLVMEIIKAVFPKRKLALDAAGSFAKEEINFENIIQNNNLAYLEDPYSDDDWDKWKEIFKKVGEKVLIVGDDLTVTNPERIERAAKEKAINAVIIKPNQNGTITGTLRAVEVSRKNDLKVVVSHRAEETEDSWIVDFALTVEADYVKFGGIDRGERIAKYNRLMELGMK